MHIHTYPARTADRARGCPGREVNLPGGQCVFLDKQARFTCVYNTC